MGPIICKMEFFRTYMIERASAIIMKKETADKIENIYIRKNTFEATKKEPYYEDYCVVFDLDNEGYHYSSTFYLQWYDDILDSPDELYIKKTRLI